MSLLYERVKKLIKVVDIDVKDLKVYKTLRDNAFDDEDSFIADSPKVVNLLLESDIKIKSILATQAYYDENKDLVKSKNIEKLFVVDKALMQGIVGHKIHHNCMAHGVRPKPHRLDELDDQILMLDAITSTENVGSIARSMAGIGIASYLLPSTSPHPYGRRALRVSMGYMSRLKYHIYTDIFSCIKELKQRGYKIYAAELTPDARFLQDVKVSSKWVLLMGHEGKGIAKEILDICDEVVSIEMQAGVKSFNVAVAASLIMYQFKNKN
ncbi:MAG: RNA methyltransferase [Sulfurimonas sp.]|nr:RNA methyltransferase [Sulfurimonas sp.]MDQ7060478.1 RNA methyltransferase [Sulfurimonas sp.]